MGIRRNVTLAFFVNTQKIPSDSAAYMCHHIDDAFDLDILRSVLVALVSGLTNEQGDKFRDSRVIGKEDNAHIANVHYITSTGVFMSALERVNRLLQLSHEAQEKTVFADTRLGVINTPYLRQFLSMIPNPSRLWEIPEG